MATPPTNRTIAERVREAMETADRSEVTLALDTGIARSTLRRRLAGTTPWLTSELVAIASVLDVGLLDLLADEEVGVA
jgi:hypothetical protein